MSLSKETTVDQITILENGIVLIRETIKIFDSETEVNKQYHRISLTPGQNISDQPKQVQDICNLVWTPEVVAVYQEQVSQSIEIGV